MERKSKPNWWVVFALVPLMIGAILIESQFKYAVQIHGIVDMGIVIATFGLMVGWVQVNRAAIEEEENAHETWTIEVVEPTASATQDAESPEMEFVCEPRTEHAFASYEWQVDPSLERRN